MSRWFVVVAVALLAASPAQAEPRTFMDRIKLEEAELRLLLAERNLTKAYARAAEQLGSAYRADALRIGQRYERLVEPLSASERRNRLAAQARLEHFAATHTDPAYVSSALLRLAALKMEDADEAYHRGIERYYARLERGDETGEQPRKDYGRALEYLRRLLTEYGDNPHRQIAWYLVGYCYSEMDDADNALEAFYALLRERPSSETRSEVLVRVGDYFFEGNETERALNFYRAAIASAGPWVDRALYKYAWSLYKLNRYGDAVSSFTRLVDMGEDRPDLIDEAMQYLAISYVEGFGYAGATSHMTERGSRHWDDLLLTRIADVLYESTEFASAISAYTVALDRNPVSPEALKMARRILIALHQQRLVDEAVARRLGLVRIFAPGSAWHRANRDRPELIAEADRWSESMLYDYATYHHYRELRDVAASRAPAERGYRLYLSRYAGRPRAVEVGFFLAEILYDRKEYAEALTYYTRVALSVNDPNSDMASRASYNMVLSARELFRKDPSKLELLMEVSRDFADMRPTDERTPLVLYHASRLLCDEEQFERCRDELSKLVEAYPSAELAVDAIRTVIDSFAKQRRYGELAAWADRLLAGGRVQDPETRRYVVEMVGGSMFRDALVQDRGGKAEEAAARYLAVYHRYPKTPAGEAALFNAAYSYEKARRFLDSLELYDTLIEKHPAAKFAPRSAFRRGQIYENAVNYPQAISAYSLVASRYPQAPEARESLYNVGALQALIGRHAEAALSFERHYAVYGASATDPAGNLLRAAAQWELAGDEARARQLFLDYTRLPYATAQRAYAGLRTAELTLGEKERARMFKKVLDYAGAVTDGSAIEILGAARFELAEADRRDYMRIALPDTARGVLDALNRKAAALKKLQDAYTWVIEAGAIEFGVAAMYRIGEAYAVFAEMLYNAPVPRSLNEEEAEIYRFELEQRAMPVEDKAVQAFKRAADRASKDGRETKWSALIRRSLHDKPNRVRILTARLEPLFLPAAHGLKPPAALELDQEQMETVVAVEDFDAKELGVAESRVQSLVDGIVQRQRIFFHNERPYIDRVAVEER